MYNVALVQNQSEMSHYGYADARPMLKEFGYSPDPSLCLYTAQNIDELESDLPKFDAVLFASNALNDKTIRNVVLAPDFRKSFINFLGLGKGCLILHQLRMAQDGIMLSFLPDPLGDIKPTARREEDSAENGDLNLTLAGKEHITFLYPHSVDIQTVKRQCLTFKSLKGLYWHYWDNVPQTEWDILLYDLGPEGQRPLVVSAKESEPFRIVLCALTVDWQKQKRLLHNLLTYVVEGEHRTAIIKDARQSHTGFEYLLEYLRSQKYPFRIYDISQNLTDLRHNIENRVHSILIFGPHVDSDKMDQQIKRLVADHVADGTMKVLSIAQEKFYIAGRERYALRLLHDLELKVQHEVNGGYIDGSFWSTVESLQALRSMGSHVRSRYDEQTLKRVLDLAKKHDKDGSYDQVFGVSCALLWLRATYQGLKNPDSMRTLKWVREKLAEYEDREKALAYSTFVDIGGASEEEKEALRQLLLAQLVRLDQFSEIDATVYLRAAISIGFKDMIVPVIHRLAITQKDGCWVDLATTATTLVALHDSRAFLKREDTDAYVRIQEKLEPAIFRSVTYIQNSIDKSASSQYPWDNKASTSLKCIYAWLQFEESVDLPLQELVDALRSYVSTEVFKSSTRTGLTILEEIRNENRQLSKSLSEMATEAKKAKSTARTNRILWAGFSTLVYIFLGITLYSLDRGFKEPIGEIFKGTFIHGWPFHLGFITLIVTILGIYPQIKQKRKSDEASK